MEVQTTGLGAGIQWDEIQRAVRQRSAQRQSVLAERYGSAQQALAIPEAPNDESKQQRTVFTRNGQLKQNFVPKGTLFDRTA